jgi:hypothetical protein
MKEIDKAKAVVRLISDRLSIAIEQLISAEAEVGKNKSGQSAWEKEHEDIICGPRTNPYDGRLEIDQKNLSKARAEKDGWKEVYDFAVETFLDKYDPERGDTGKSS